MKQDIIIWDEDAKRIHQLEPNLRMALSNKGIDASIQVNCEPPLLSRHNLIGNTPAFTINGGDFWRHGVGEPVSVKQFEALLDRLSRDKLLRV